MPGIGLLVTLFAFSSAYSDLSDAEYLARAETAFHAGNERQSSPAEARPYFQNAAHQYEQLRSRGVDGTAINHNLGNAYLLGGDVPRAILAYRRALRFAGADRRIQEGLRFARSQVAYPSGASVGKPPIDHRPPWLPRLPPIWYLCVGLSANAFGWLAMARWWSGRPGHWLIWALSAFAIAFLSIGGLVAEEMRDAEIARHPVVVLSEDGVLLRTGNGLSYPPRSEIPLNRGVEARLLFIRGDWLQIELGSGEIGWVPREYALIDEPGGD
jgi:hypothetical protein